MRFLESTEHLGPDVQRAVLARIEAAGCCDGAARRMVENFTAERLPDASSWCDLAHVILGLADDDGAGVCEAIREFCSSEARVLKGPPAVLHDAQVLGRISTWERLARLAWKSGEYPSELDAIEAIGEALERETIPDLGEWPIAYGGFTWATFEDGCSDPFVGDEWTAAAWRCNLGLDPVSPSERSLVLDYRLPVAVVARTPTFFDGYCSWPWNPWFAAAQTEKHGRTRPRTGCEHPTHAGRPEVVHATVHIRAAIRLRRIP